MSGDSGRDEYEVALVAVAAGEVKALERLYRDLRVVVFAVALAIVGDRSTAEDVVHDTFVRVWERARTYQPGTRPHAWVCAIARNLAVDVLRRRRRSSSYRERAAVADDALELPLWTSALMGLEPVERELVVLHVLAGLSHREVAEQLGLPHGTVRWKYRAALGRLRDLVERSGDG